MRKTLRRLLVAGGLATMALAAAGPAAAATPTAASASCGLTRGSDNVYRACGRATFSPSASGSSLNSFHVFDTNSDGYAVVVQYYRYDLAASGPYSLWLTTGANTSKVWYFTSITAGQRVSFRVCAGDGSTKTVLSSTCGGWVNGYSS
jgi:hypothetical protein